jgi:hypothetical protein
MAAEPDKPEGAKVHDPAPSRKQPSQPLIKSSRSSRKRKGLGFNRVFYHNRWQPTQAALIGEGMYH